MTLSDLMPDDMPVYILDAWVSALHWAIKEPKILAAFETATKIHWRPGLTPIDRMIDEATGADCKFLEAFASWFNVNVWGVCQLKDL